MEIKHHHPILSKILKFKAMFFLIIASVAVFLTDSGYAVNLIFNLALYFYVISFFVQLFELRLHLFYAYSATIIYTALFFLIEIDILLTTRRASQIFGNFTEMAPFVMVIIGLPMALVAYFVVRRHHIVNSQKKSYSAEPGNAIRSGPES